MIINPYTYAAAGGGGGSDPYFANVVSLLHFDGANNSTTFTDQTGKAWSRVNTPTISTAQSVYGGASGLFFSTDYITTPDHADWDFGSGDFTLEGRVQPDSTGTAEGLFSKTQVAGGYSPFTLYKTSAGALQFYMSSNGTSWDIASGVVLGTIGLGSWYSWAVCRVGGTTLWTFLDGSGTSTTIPGTAVVTNTELVALSRHGTVNFYGYMDEFRATKGVARYTASYTPAGSAFPDS